MAGNVGGCPWYLCNQTPTHLPGVHFCDRLPTTSLQWHIAYFAALALVSPRVFQILLPMEN